MSIRIIESIPRHRGVNVRWIKVDKKDAERVARDLALDLRRTIDLYDRAGAYIKHIEGVK